MEACVDRSERNSFNSRGKKGKGEKTVFIQQGSIAESAENKMQGTQAKQEMDKTDMSSHRKNSQKIPPPTGAANQHQRYPKWQPVGNGTSQEGQSFDNGTHQEGQSLTMAPTRRGSHSTMAPPRRGSHSTMAPTRRGSHSTMAPTRRGSHSTMAPTRRGSHSIMAPTRRGSHSTMAPTRRGSRSTKSSRMEVIALIDLMFFLVVRYILNNFPPADTQDALV